jgi:hypothetical protein
MNTSSMKTLTALFAVGAMLSSSVFAGPGPKGAPDTGRNVTTTTQTAPTVAFGGTKSAKAQAKPTKSGTTFTRSNRYVYDLQGHVTVDF